MKRYWIIVRGVGRSDRCVEVDFDDVLDSWKDPTFPTESSAESHARELAKKHPGITFSVFGLTASFVVDGLREERPQ